MNPFPPEPGTWTSAPERIPHACDGAACVTCPGNFAWTVADDYQAGTRIVSVYGIDGKMTRQMHYPALIGSLLLPVPGRDRDRYVVLIMPPYRYPALTAGYSSGGLPVIGWPAPQAAMATTAVPKTESPFDAPIRAIKAVHLQWDRAAPYVGTGFGTDNYGPAATAVCTARAHGYPSTYDGCGQTRRLPPHEAPHPLCTCGFYAAARPWWLDQEGWTIETELWGRVIEHAAGWRARHQRVTAVRLPRRCFYCHRQNAEMPGSGAGGPDALLTLDHAFNRVYRTCGSCGRGQRVVTLDGLRQLLSPVEVGYHPHDARILKGKVTPG